jgi:hypothetical protein
VINRGKIGNGNLIKGLERASGEREGAEIGQRVPASDWGQGDRAGRYAFRKISRSALMVSASVVGMPCGKPW